MDDLEELVVVGQGYVGLPLAIRAAEVGFRVTGVDTDPRRMDLLRAGVSFVEDIDDVRLQRVLTAGTYRPAASISDARAFDVAVITVPTPLREGQPDLSMIEAATRSVGDHLSRGATVVLESTTYPGTTDELVAPLLEAASGLRRGVDFHLGYSPERIDPGNNTWTLVNTPKVVSGIDEGSLIQVRKFYESIVDETVVVSSCRVAELTKLLENTFRHVNIALMNELAVFAHDLDIDVWEAIDAASTKPFGYMRFTPGPGVGGHCLPVDPSYLSWQVRRTLGHNFRFIELANDVNDHMPDYVVNRAMALLNDESKATKGSRILLVGLAYKKNTGDARQSPAVRVAELLVERGAEVVAVDPHIDPRSMPRGVRAVELTARELVAADLTILLTDHDDLVERLLAANDVLVLDTRNRLTPRSGVHRL
ncbi:MAG: nucleotide sugar dehydrogenase [Candidatus Dormibacteria bacterium]